MQPHNPTGTNGFEFLEFSTHQPDILDKQFTSLGFTPVAKHRNQDVTIYQQHDIKFLVNITPNSMANQFAEKHGPSTSAMGFRVKNAKETFDRAVSLGAKPYQTDKPIYNLFAIYGVGESLIYFVDDDASWMKDFVEIKNSIRNEKGLTYLDHVTHNLHRGQMDKWADFYSSIFNFHEVRYFDIEGKLTGLKSRAMASPCGKIRIPLNESSDDKSQIEEFLKDFKGEGIQHIALGTDDIYESVEQLRATGLEFLTTPDTYYELMEKRLPNHGEQAERLKKNRILMDGTTQPKRKLLLQIFTKTMLGPVFFEIIQRKGDEGFGEGNFRALFESIELDQIRRGVLTENNK